MTNVLFSLLVACATGADTGGSDAPATLSRVHATVFTSA